MARYKRGPTIAAICKSALTGKLGSIREYGGIQQLELVATYDSGEVEFEAGAAPNH